MAGTTNISDADIDKTLKNFAYWFKNYVRMNIFNSFLLLMINENNM